MHIKVDACWSDDELLVKFIEDILNLKPKQVIVFRDASTHTRDSEKPKWSELSTLANYKEDNVVIDELYELGLLPKSTSAKLKEDDPLKHDPTELIVSPSQTAESETAAATPADNDPGQIQPTESDPAAAEPVDDNSTNSPLSETESTGTPESGGGVISWIGRIWK